MQNLFLEKKRGAHCLLTQAVPVNLQADKAVDEFDAYLANYFGSSSMQPMDW